MILKYSLIGSIPTLKRYQSLALEFALANENKLTYLALPPGAGKTLVALCLALESPENYKILVVCNSTIVDIWANEIEKFQIPLTYTVQRKRNHVADNNRIRICSYSNAVFLADTYDLIIFDEAHNLKTWQANRTRKLLVAKESLANGAKKVICLSGTPVLNRPMELFPILRFSNLLPDKWRKYRDFAFYFCEGYTNGYNKIVATGAAYMDDLRPLLSNFFVIDRSVVEKELPPVETSIVRFSSLSRFDYNKLPYDVASIVARRTPVGFEGLSELRHEMAMEKAPQVLEYAQEILSGEEPVIIFCWHTELIDYLRHELTEHNPLVISGSVLSKNRDGIQKAFNSGQSKLIICQIVTASEGISLTAAKHVIFAEISWSPSQNYQAIKRAHRRGIEHKLMVHMLVQSRSLDDYILQRGFEKEALIEYIFQDKKIFSETFDNEQYAVHNTPTHQSKEIDMSNKDMNLEKLHTDTLAAFQGLRGYFDTLIKALEVYHDKAFTVKPIEPVTVTIEALPTIPSVTQISTESKPATVIESHSEVATPKYMVSTTSEFLPWQTRIREKAQMLIKLHGVTVMEIKHIMTPFVDMETFVAANDEASKHSIKFIPETCENAVMEKLAALESSKTSEI